VKFAITLHSGSGAPDDALELLWAQLGPSRDGVRFVAATGEIRASVNEEDFSSMESDIRSRMGRRMVLGVLEGVCERGPGLKLGWFAVATRRY
jgi:hypothetical protein